MECSGRLTDNRDVHTPMTRSAKSPAGAPQVDREKMDQLFAANSYGSEDRHNGSDHDYPRAIEPVNQRAIEPVNIGPPSAASGHHSPAVTAQPRNPAAPAHCPTIPGSHCTS